MIVAACLAFAFQSAPFAIQRDDYGVPVVRADSTANAFEGAGYAVAQDRLWQMEMSRRLSEGRLAEALGSKYVASDRDVHKLGYTKEEVLAQVARLSAASRSYFEAYVRGVNRCIEERRSHGTLPPEYAASGLSPEPWTVFDSASIAIHLLQLFGSGGGGEIRDMALLQYLMNRKETSARALDIFDDLAWLNDKDSPTTLRPEDDPVKVRPVFPQPTHAGTLKQLAALPKLSLFEMMPGLRVLEQPTSKMVAMNLATPFKTGSYCIVVGPGRSLTGKPLLLSGPQMGFTKPSIAHEIGLRSGAGLNVTGLDVPGVPGVLVGGTPKIAWGITTGVGDIEDVFASPRSGDEYSYGRERAPIQHVGFEIPVKGGAPVKVDQLRTRFGPVLASSASGLFSLHRSFEGAELSSLEGLYDLYSASDSKAVEALSSKITLSFNLFFAAASGEIGWRFEGKFPVRNPSLDPRLPTPGVPENEWRGFISLAQMPHVVNPREGLIVNWNNKPAVWWPNGDTPAWGAIFRNLEILDQLKSPAISVSDLERTIWTIARRDENFRLLAPYLKPLGFDGMALDGSRGAWLYEKVLPRLRKAIFAATMGDLVSPEFFNLVLQPSLMLRAMQGRTHFDYLKGRKVADLVAESMQGLDPDTRWKANAIRLPGLEPIPYSNRGTYIQVLELSSRGTWIGRSVMPPGEAESGEHSADQAPLSRMWLFKPSWIGLL